MPNRPNTRLIRHRASQSQIRHKASEVKKAARHLSHHQVAKAFGMITPSGQPNARAVAHILTGYLPRNIDTLRRWGLLAPPTPPDEPARRVLSGAWKLRGRWVSPEEYFKGRS
jgi:hypothetical protein